MEASVFILAIIAAQGFNGPATEHATRAFIAQNQIDVTLDRYSRSLTTPETRRKLDDVAILTQVIVERRIVLKWEY
jgi:hypothetical protein